MKNLIINITDNQIEIFLVETSFRTITVMKRFELEIKCKSAYMDNELLYGTPENTRKLRSLIKSNNLSNKKANLILSIDGLVTREIEIPVINKVNIGKFIHNNIEEYFTINKADYYFDYKITSINKKENKMKLFLAAVPKQKLTDIKKLMDNGGITLNKINIYPDCILNLYKNIKSQGIACLDIGKKKSTLSIIKDGSLFLYSLINVSIEEETEDEFRDVVDSFNYFLNFYSSRYFGNTVDRIYLIGEYAQSETLVNILKEHHDIHINWGLRNRNIRFKDSTTKSTYKNMGLMGALLSNKPIYGKHIEFSKNELEGTDYSLKSELVSVIIILTLLTGAWTCLFAWYVNNNSAAYDTSIIDRKTAEISDVEKEINDLNMKKKQLREKTDIINEINSDSFNYTHVIEALQNGLPTSCKIISVEMDKEYVNPTFQILDKKTLNAAKLVIAINRMNVFEPIELEELNMDDNIETISLVLKIK